MTDDDPLDLNAVAADDAAVERLRAGADVSDDDVLALLRDLLADVGTDLPAETPAVLQPVGRGSTVLTLAGEGAHDRRLARGGTVVVALAAGLVSLGGVAAASTLVPGAGPLHGLGEAVRSAAGALVGAVTPPKSAGRVPVAAGSPSASPAAQATAPRPAPTGAAVAADARSLAAARQVGQLLDQAEALIGDGRGKAAVARLDLAERKLGEVLPAHRGGLPDRLADLRGRVTPAPAPAKPAKPAKTSPPKQQAPKPAPKQQAPKQQPAERKGEPGAKTDGKADSKGGGKGDGKAAPLLPQPASDASAKPLA